jgi:hypothetical protein
MPHTIQEIQDELRSANTCIVDSQSAAEGAANYAEEAYSYASSAQENADEASSYAENAEGYIRGVLEMLDAGIETELSDNNFIEPLSLLNEKVTAIAALVNDALTALNGILLDINNHHLPLDPNTFKVTHTIKDTEDSQDTTPEKVEV